jgi:hypothetical protein
MNLSYKYILDFTLIDNATVLSEKSTQEKLDEI